MNKLTIPALLVATVMVAGVFAFAPVEQASTVHTTSTATLSTAQTALIADEMLEIREITGTDLNFGDGTVAIEIDVVAAADRFTVLSVVVGPGTTTPATAGDDCVVDAVTVDGAIVAMVTSGDFDCGTGDTPIELLSELTIDNTLTGNLIVFVLSDGTTQPEDTDDLNVVVQILIRNSAGNPTVTIE